MQHLSYQQVNNRTYKDYLKRFKNSLNERLPEGSAGWFLLVKDFPFKDGDNLMLTLGDDLGKWRDKNLTSLYGKKNYLIGRCIWKTGKQFLLIDFQEGDYIKSATESGLRNELKDFGRPLGAQFRVFKSMKYKEAQALPDLKEDSYDEPDRQQEPESAKAKVDLPQLDTSSEKKQYISKMAREIPQKALKSGLSEELTYKRKWIDLNRFVRVGKEEESLEVVRELLTMLRDYEGEGPSEENKEAARILSLEAELNQIKARESALRRAISQALAEASKGNTSRLQDQLAALKKGKTKTLELQDMLNSQQERRKTLEKELAQIS